MKTLHPIQIDILEKLLFSTWMKFSELKPNDDIPSNQLTFHINTLLDEWLLEKIESHYVLTAQWKLYANAKDSHRDNTHKFQKVWVIMACSRINKWIVEYLLYTRKKHPFFGKQWFPTWKIRRGETPVQTASRELWEETWMKGNAELIKLFHFINMNSDDEVIEDKYLFLCHISAPQWELCNNNEWEFYWLPENSIRENIKNPFDTIEDLLWMIEVIKADRNNIQFEETIWVPEWF